MESYGTNNVYFFIVYLARVKQNVKTEKRILAQTHIIKLSYAYAYTVKEKEKQRGRRRKTHC